MPEKKSSSPSSTHLPSADTKFREPPSPENSLASIIGHFVLDQKNIWSFVKNGYDYKELYNIFLKNHPNIQISFDVFQEEVIECVKRTLSAAGAELAAVPGSVAGSALNEAMKMPLESVGKMAFTGSILANFAVFAGTFITSHRSRFRKENGKMDIPNMVKSLVQEYGAHFGPIALSADFLESVIIQSLANNNMDGMAASAIVTTIGSVLAVALYFYEQQARIVLAKKLAKIDMDKGIAGLVIRARNRIGVLATSPMAQAIEKLPVW